MRTLNRPLDERPDCWICAWVYKRERPKTHHCQNCGRGFCSQEHGVIADDLALCLICRELEERTYECNCDWLDNAARDPETPVGFDEEVNEFYIERRNGRGEVNGQMVIYRCPFCGGSPPPSIRESLFEFVTSEERIRLIDLTKNLHTVEDVFKAFGPPAADLPAGYGETTHERDGQPERMVNYRVLQYDNLSPTAQLEVIVHDSEQIRIAIVSKPRQKASDHCSQTRIS